MRAVLVALVLFLAIPAGAGTYLQKWKGGLSDNRDFGARVVFRIVGVTSRTEPVVGQCNACVAPGACPCTTQAECDIRGCVGGSTGVTVYDVAATCVRGRLCVKKKGRGAFTVRDDGVASAEARFGRRLCTFTMDTDPVRFLPIDPELPIGEILQGDYNCPGSGGTFAFQRVE